MMKHPWSHENGSVFLFSKVQLSRLYDDLALAPSEGSFTWAQSGAFVRDARTSVTNRTYARNICVDIKCKKNSTQADSYSRHCFWRFGNSACSIEHGHTVWTHVHHHGSTAGFAHADGIHSCPHIPDTDDHSANVHVDVHVLVKQVPRAVEWSMRRQTDRLQHQRCINKAFQS